MSDEEFLMAVRQYIEECETKIEAEWGMGQPLDRLIFDGKMPKLYDEVLRRLGVT